MYLSSPEGQITQDKAYADMLDIYDTPEAAFEAAVHEEKSAYVVGFVRETLRYYPPLHLLPPRQTLKDFQYGQTHVPQGMMVLVNCQAANRGTYTHQPSLLSVLLTGNDADPATYGPDAHIFRPERWLEKESSERVPPPFEFAFGAGSRMCTAVNFSNRILYTIFVRLIVSFRIRQSDTHLPCLHYTNYNQDTTGSTAVPKEFKASFVVRNREMHDVCLQRSEENTRDAGNGIVR
jgi:phenylacetate 2-hydroxylase